MKKALCAVLTAALVCGLCGCAKNGEGSLYNGTDGISEEVSDASQGGQSDVSADISSENSVGSTEFDFSEAAKNITLFGNKIPFPCTIKEFGEDFSLDDPSEMVLMESTHQVTSSLLYRGKSIGTVVLDDCGENDTFADKQISYLSLGFLLDNGHMSEEQRKLSFDAYGWYTDPIKFEFAGISFETSAEEITAKLGAPKEDTEEVNYYDTKIRKINYVFSDGKYLYFSFADGKMYLVSISFGKAITGGIDNEH